MSVTKITKPVTVNVPESGTVVIDGFDFTGEGSVSIQGAVDITVRNCRVYGITDSAWLKVAGGKKLTLENNFFGPSASVANAVELQSTATEMANANMSHNYFADGAFTDRVVDAEMVADNGQVNMTGNQVEKGTLPIKLGTADKTCKFIIGQSALSASGSDDPIMQGLVELSPAAGDTTFAGMTIEMSNNTCPGEYPIVAICEDGALQLTPDLLPAMTINGQAMKNIPIVADATVAIVAGASYTTLNEAVAAAAASGEKMILMKSVAQDLAIPVGSTVIIEGRTQDVTLTGVSLGAKGTTATTVTLKNLTLEGGDYGIISQNQTDTEQVDAILNLENCIIKDMTAKGLYMTNAKILNVTNCTFDNCASGPMDDPNTRGDYGFDLNLIAVQNAKITLTGCTFVNAAGKKAAIKVSARGGASDAGASDIPKNVGEATVASLVVDGCTFTTEGTTFCDVRIGTNSKTPGSDALNTTGNYPVEIKNCTTPVRVVLGAHSEETIYNVPVGSVAVQADNDFTIDGVSVFPAAIGDKMYVSLAAAIAAAKSGDTITLRTDITCDNSAIDSGVNTPVFNIPDGVILDGGNHTITADAEKWVGSTTANAIIGVVAGSNTIRNVTIVGHAKTKSGIVLSGQTVNTVLENVTVKNCGTVGVQITNGAVVDITNYQSEGNNWGSINVDKGSGSSATNPTVTFNSGVMAENVEVYTEVLDETVITAPTLEEVIGVGTNLKGFKYYTSDKARLGVAYIVHSDGTTSVYQTMEEAESAKQEDETIVEL